MKIEEINPLMELLKMLCPLDTEEQIKKVMAQTDNNKGEYTSRLRPSDCLVLIQAYRNLKSKIETAQLAGSEEF